MMFKPDKIHVDLETYSSVDLRRCGVHKYATSPDFEILLATFGFYRDGVRVYDQYEPTNGRPIPPVIWSWLEDPEVEKYAFNAMFERVCFGAVRGRDFDPAQWRCVMVKSGAAGLPLSLDRVSKVLDLENVKLAGAHLINYFSKPCKPTKANGGRTRNLPADNLEKWAEYKAYNLGDVAAEWDIDEYLDREGVVVPLDEWDYYATDQRINDRGVYVARTMAENGCRMASEIKEGMIEDIERLTGIGNARSVSQLRAWLAANDCEMDDLRAESVRGALTLLPDGPARRVLSLREQVSRTSTDKYAAALACIDTDSRARGLFAFYGAYRTGRFAGRRVQLQNLSRIHFTDGSKDETRTLDLARSVVCRGDTELLGMMYENPIEILSELIRTIFTGAPGRSIVAADYSAIEARVLAWLAGEEWKLEVFRTHGKIYEATAARMFGVPFESVKKGSDLRQKGKVGELAFGYEGSVGAVEKMGFLKDGTLTIAEVQRMVKSWRRENPRIVRMWRSVENAAIKAVKCPGGEYKAARCTFRSNGGWLFITLPSGRSLAYFRPRIRPNKWGEDALHYEGENDRSQWEVVGTYGGKLSENITQAVSRDLLCEAQRRIEAAGYGIVLHVHDEVAVEVESRHADAVLKHICNIMAKVPAWAEGLPLRADGFVSKYYRK